MCVWLFQCVLQSWFEIMKKKEITPVKSGELINCNLFYFGYFLVSNKANITLS